MLYIHNLTVNGLIGTSTLDLNRPRWLYGCFGDPPRFTYRAGGRRAPLPTSGRAALKTQRINVRGLALFII
jgi:hypothetical protein